MTYRVRIEFAQRESWSQELTATEAYAVEASSGPGAIRKALGIARQGLTRYCVDNIYAVHVDRLPA